MAMRQVLWGIFWLKGQEDDAQHGTLVVDPMREIELHLGRELTKGLEIIPPTDVSPGSVGWRDDEDSETQIVYGWLNEIPRAVTLFECVTFHRRASLASAGAETEQSLRPTYALRGGHLEEDFVSDALSARYDGLDAWSDLCLFTINEDPSSPSVLDISPRQIVPARLAGLGLLKLEPEIRGQGDYLGARIIQKMWLRLTEIEAPSWREVDRLYLTPLETLFTLCIGKRAPTTEVWVHARHGPWLQSVGKGSNSSPVLDNKLLPDRVPLGLQSVGLSSVAKWLDRVEALGPLPPVVANAVAGNTESTIETQIIELTSIVDGLHRRAVDSSRMNYKRRLLSVAQIAEEALPGVTGDQPGWARMVEQARNDFTHRENQFLGPNGEVDRYVVLISSLRLVLRAFLLRQADIPTSIVRDSITTSQTWTLFAKQARRLVPEIYNDSTMPK